MYIGKLLNIDKNLTRIQHRLLCFLCCPFCPFANLKKVQVNTLLQIEKLE